MAENRARLPFEERAGGAQAKTRRDPGRFELYERGGFRILVENAACGNADRRVLSEARRPLRRRFVRSAQPAAEFAIWPAGSAYRGPERGQSTATPVDARVEGGAGAHFGRHSVSAEPATPYRRTYQHSTALHQP